MKATLNPNERLYKCQVPIIGLSGSIATGKSTVSQLLRKRGFCVICADDLIHEIYSKEQTLSLIERLVPEAINSKEKSIHFPILRKVFFNNLEIRKEIENHLYQQLPATFLKKVQGDFVVYDVPLLYEKSLHQKVDLHGIVYTTPELQRERLALRDQNSDEDTLSRIIASQMSIDEKRKLAAFVIENVSTTHDLESEVDRFIEDYLA